MKYFINTHFSPTVKTIYIKVKKGRPNGHPFLLYKQLC